MVIHIRKVQLGKDMPGAELAEVEEIVAVVNGAWLLLCCANERAEETKQRP